MIGIPYIFLKKLHDQVREEPAITEKQRQSIRAYDDHQWQLRKERLKELWPAHVKYTEDIIEYRKLPWYRRLITRIPKDPLKKL